ncbi:MAG: GYF domain-containing protein [Phycisphaerae bacterium]
MSEWYCYSQGQQRGPMPADELRSGIESGQVSPDDQVWTEGMDDWQPVREVAEFADACSAAPAAGPPPAGFEPAYQPPHSQYTYLEKHRGETILVLGILGFVVCPILSIFAWVMGNGDLQKIRAGQMDPSGESLTNAGRVCGLIGTILLIGWTGLFCLSFGLPMLLAGVGAGM